jgi:hypothetical protein
MPCCCWLPFQRLGCSLASLAAGAPGVAQLAVAVLKCTEAWLRLNQVSGGGSILTPGELNAQQVGRWRPVVRSQT